MLIVNEASFSHHWHYITLPLGIISNLISGTALVLGNRIQKRLAALEAAK